MADAEEKAKQVAAARKRVEALKKKNKKAASKKTKEESADAPAAEAEDVASEQAEAGEPSTATEKPEDEAVEEASPPSPSATPSLAAQSKMRSTSFRAGISSGGAAAPSGPFSPEGDTAPDIYRKNMARIEELEKENKRLVKESSDSEKRWKKAEEELADLREADGDAPGKANADGDVEKLKDEVTSLQRQNAQLQQQVSRGAGHGHRQSISMASPPPHIKAELDSKSATIEQMEIELSKLKARLERQESGASSEKDQITALEEKVGRAEAAAGKAQRELQDLKKNLERTAEKAVKEGSERSSAETRVKTLERELEEATSAKEELAKKADGLEKKVATLTTLHKEQDTRSQALRKEKEKLEKDVKDMQSKVEKLESENVKLRSRKSAEGGGGLDDEGVDELENEERDKLLKKIRSLETELHDMRSGAWIQRRREMEATSPGFQDVDLHSSTMGPSSHKKPQAAGGISDFFASGLNALAGTGNDELLEDDDMDFDEDAFRKAHEEESKNRLERIKEIKRSLKHWEGWRLDIVDIRRGGGEGIGDIFDV